MFKRHPLLFFLLLAYPLSWYPWIIALMHGKASGPNPLGPFIAALIVTSLAYGWSGLKLFLKRIVRWRVNIRWYLTVLFIPIFAVIVSAWITEMITMPQANAAKLASWRDVVDRFIFIFLFIGLGEETGWRGFALEELQKKRSAIQASWIIAPIWAIWHLPLFGTEITFNLLPQFLIGLTAATFLSTWIYNRTNGSVLLLMIFHTTVNTVGAGFVFPLFQGTALVMLWWIYVIVWALIAAIVVFTVGIERRKSGVEIV